ncbi:MAG: hypothetical protein ACFE68_09720, partial [Candidatus Hodarchaeota archaeon]
MEDVMGFDDGDEGSNRGEEVRNFSAYRATLLVFSASLIWGSSFPAVKWGLNLGLDPLFFVIFRFLVAVIVALPFLIYLLKGKGFFESFSSAFLVLGLLNALALIFQFYGM